MRYRRNWRGPSVPPLYPCMKLAGRWIEDAGFAPGQRVRIAVEHGQLTITAE
jgi:toxic protein SymE